MEPHGGFQTLKVGSGCPALCIEMIESRQDSMQYAPPFNHATTSYFNSSKLNKGKEYEGIPGSSKCVKCVLFTQKNIPKWKIQVCQNIYFFPYVNSTADKISWCDRWATLFAGYSSGRCPLGWPLGTFLGKGGCGGSISHTIHGTCIFAYMIG